MFALSLDLTKKKNTAKNNGHMFIQLRLFCFIHTLLYICAHTFTKRQRCEVFRPPGRNNVGHLCFCILFFSTVYNKLQQSPHTVIPSINILIPFHLHWGINIQHAVQFSSTPCRYYTDAFFHIQWTFNHLEDGPGTHKALMVVWRSGSCCQLSSGLTMQDGWANTMAVSLTRFSRKQYGVCMVWIQVAWVIGGEGVRGETNVP